MRPLALRSALPALALVLGCSTGPTAPRVADTLESPAVTTDGLSWRASVDVLESFPVQLAGRMTATNPGPEDRELVFQNGCTARLRVYHTDVQGALAWDQADAVACATGLQTIRIAAGESHTFEAPIVDAGTILGGELPDGTYRVAVYLRPNGRNIERDTGSTELAAFRR